MSKELRKKKKKEKLKYPIKLSFTSKRDGISEISIIIM